MTISKKLYLSIISYSLLFFIFFPYLTFFVTPWSLQPYALFVSIIYLISIGQTRINKRILIFLIAGILSFLIAILSFSQPINSIRSVANYISLPVITWAVYILDIAPKKIERFILVSAITYFLVGCIQFFINPDFLSYLVARQGGNLLGGRGVSSITPEPSYFGFTMLLYFFIGIFLNNKKIMAISIISILFLSQSISVLGCLFSSVFILYSLKNKLSFCISLVSLVVLYISLYTFINTIELNSRSLLLINSFLSNGVNSTLTNDESSSGRLFHIIYPITSSYNHFFLPMGYNGLPNGDARILSGLAGAIYELGFVSFLIIVTLLEITFLNRNIKINIRIGIGIGLFLFLLNANQIGMPILCFIIGYLLKKKYEGPNFRWSRLYWK